jgi:phosphoglycolate phosphatase
MIRSVLFDFDGTMIHSAPGILAGFERVLATHGITPKETIDQSVIGPPLMATLRRLTGIANEPALEELALAFRTTYDGAGILEAHPYPELVETLLLLRSAGRHSYVVTNKRRVPTRLIADRLNVTPLVEELYSLDSLSPPAIRKNALVSYVLSTHSIDAAEAVLVGDSVEDAEAAAANGMRFIAALYGYGDPLRFTGPKPSGTIASLAELPLLLGRLA